MLDRFLKQLNFQPLFGQTTLWVKNYLGNYKMQIQVDQKKL